MPDLLPPPRHPLSLPLSLSLLLLPPHTPLQQAGELSWTPACSGPQDCPAGNATTMCAVHTLRMRGCRDLCGASKQDAGRIEPDSCSYCVRACVHAVRVCLCVCVCVCVRSPYPSNHGGIILFKVQSLIMRSCKQLAWQSGVRNGGSPEALGCIRQTNSHPTEQCGADAVHSVHCTGYKGSAQVE